MKRQLLLKRLESYRSTWAAGRIRYAGYDEALENKNLKEIVRFIQSTPDCFERSHQAGHVTGSSLVVSADLNRVILTHHAKLNLWLQLGGHADGHHLIHEVALREAEEESGISGLTFLNYDIIFADSPGRDGRKRSVERNDPPLPFDLDYHDIPSRPGEPRHIHYDIRYLLVAPDNNSAPSISEESHDVRWFSLQDAYTKTQEASMHRQFNKLAAIKTLL